MLELEVNNTATGVRSLHPLEPGEWTIGRGEDNDVVLPSRTVSLRNLVLRVADGGLTLTDVGRNACFVAGRPATKERPEPLAPGDEVQLAEYTLRVLGTREEAHQAPRWHTLAVETLAAVHEELVQRQHRERRGERWTEDRLRRELEEVVEARLEVPDADARERLDALTAYALHARAVTLGVRESGAGGPDEHGKRLADLERELDRRVERLCRALPTEAREGLADIARLAPSAPRFAALAQELDRALRHYAVRVLLDEELRALVFGFGPLERPLRQADVSEIMVVGPDRVWVERKGRLEATGLRFLSAEALTEVIRRMVAPLGRRIDRSSPIVDGRLPQGYRVNAVLPPVGVQGPCLTIRKFPEQAPGLADLERWGSFGPDAGTLLRAFVAGRKNIVVAGGTGSGKTTLLNALGEAIGRAERVVTVEDSAELRLPVDHVVTLEAVPANLEGEGAIPIRRLVVNALRMRPDRIVVGECRGDEAVDMLQAMNTGHAGSMTSLHANSAADALQRLESMVLGAQDLPVAAIRRQIASAVDVIVHVGRTRTGLRRTFEIVEVGDVDEDTGEVRLAPLFERAGDPDANDLLPTGRMPSFVDELVALGHLDVGEWMAIP